MTDTDGEVRYDRAAKPGLANLLELLAAATGRTPVEVAAGYERYGDLKNDVAEALCELLRPVRAAARRSSRATCPTSTRCCPGARRAPTRWPSATYARAADAIGLLPATARRAQTPRTPAHQL